MSSFLLVHGAWQGAWCWKKLVPLLQREGIAVLTPTLTGLGEKSHLLTPATDLRTHITDIVEVCKYRELKDVVLVGHSYAGMVITGVAEIVPERIDRLVYIDALVPLDRQSVLDLLPALSSLAREITLHEERIRVVPPPEPEIYGVTDPRDTAWIKPLLVPMPFNCLKQKIRIANPLASRLKKSYILCTISYSVGSEAAHRSAFNRLEADGRDCREINAPHNVMITHPSQLSKILLEYS